MPARLVQLFVVFLFSFSSACFAEKHFFIHGGFGAGAIDFPDSQDEELDTVTTALQLGIGYEFQTPISIQFNYGYMDEFFLLALFNDASYEIDYRDLLVGYRFNYKKLYVRPLLGISDSRLRLVRRDGDKAEVLSSDRDSSMVWGFDLGIDFTRHFAMSVGYKHYEPNFAINTGYKKYEAEFVDFNYISAVNFIGKF
ncbi:outer membrane beta-barrel protein [Agaribacterium haliotis]|uniref:outer membrane beta-barrel protein n=1 Tax=Agaribacterium haliotis TaxID=2013869 RepID=UPI00130420E0|nr:outer membrane beta-barrel protein [Agaribacterium haliotis]